MLLLIVGCPARAPTNGDIAAEDGATNLSCETLEEEALALRESWQGCSTADAAILSERAASCGECGEAGCDGNVQAVCNEATGLCEATSGG